MAVSIHYSIPKGVTIGEARCQNHGDGTTTLMLYIESDALYFNGTPEQLEDLLASLSSCLLVANRARLEEKAEAANAE